MSSPFFKRKESSAPHCFYYTALGFPVERYNYFIQRMGSDLALGARGLGKRYRDFVASLLPGLRPSNKAPLYVIYHSLSV